MIYILFESANVKTTDSAYFRTTDKEFMRRYMADRLSKGMKIIIKKMLDK